MVKYATLSGIEWVTARQDESGGRHAVIALDWNEAAHIVYEDRPEFFLRYAAIRNAITMKRPAVFMRMEGKTCVLEWETQKDVDYRIQFSEDLKTWSECGPVVRSKDGRVIRRSLLESEHFPDREPTKLFFRIVLSGTP
jgi:hypothetical protein